MKNLIKRIACTVLALATVMLCGVFASADTQNITTYRDAKYGVVFIRTTGKTAEGGNGAWRGTGFAVGDPNKPVEYIVTNAHVVLDGQNQKGSVRVYFSEATNDFFLATIYKINAERDVAILKLPEPTTKRTALTVVRYDEVEQGDPVYTVGYPGVTDSDTNDPHPHDTTDVTVRDGIISKKTTSDFEGGARVFLTTAQIDGGNSGGPLVNSNGQVVGINSYHLQVEGANRLHYAICMDEVLDLVPNNEVGMVFAKNYNPGTADTSNTPDTPVTPSITDTDKSSFNPTPIIIIAAVVVVAAAGVVVFMLKKNNNKPKAAPAPVQITPPQNNAGAMLICEKGVLAGRTFPIGNGVVIGRNPQQCTVCFPVDAKGVSGAHCSIRKTANGFEILDLGSSYGTTLGSGQKLTPNVPVFISSGTYFMVGGMEQLFQIKY